MDWVSNCFVQAAHHVTTFAQNVTTFVSRLWVDQSKQAEGVSINGNQTDVGVSNTASQHHQTPISAQTTSSFDIENPRSLPPIEEVVIDVSQTGVDVSDTTSLLNQTRMGAQSADSFSIEIPRSLSPIEEVVIGNVAVRDQTDVDVSNTASLPNETPVSAQVTSSLDIENPRSLSPIEEVVSNGDIVARDQTDVDVSDTASLLPRTPSRAQATSSFNIENHRNLSPEGAQNPSGVANAGSGVASQHSGQPQTANAGSPTEAQAPIALQAVIVEAKEVATRVTIISAGGIFSELSGVIGNEKAALTHRFFFKAFMILSYVSLASGLLLYRLIKISPGTQGFVTIVKCTMWIAQGSLVYAVGFAICILFPSEVGVIIILVVPIVPVGLVAIISFAHGQFRSSG